MKRFWIVLLSFSLIMAFGTSLFAADAKFNGEFYMQGWYNKNASLIDKESTAGPGNRGSSAFYTERLRMGINFEVAKGLNFYTRFDALERKWMAARTTTGGTGISSTDSEAENIAWEIAFVRFLTPIGAFLVGNMPSGQTGTPFNDYVGWDNPVIVWALAKGPWSVSVSMKKNQDGAGGGTPIGGGTDWDTDTYTLKGDYRWGTGAAGFQFSDVFNRNYSSILKVEIPFVVLYAQNKFGKIFIEDEALFIPWGKYFDYADPAGIDVKNGLGFSNYFNINVDLAPAKLGFMFVYSAGDDPTTADKREGGYHASLGNDRSFNPCLILFNDDYVKWMGALAGNVSAVSVNGVSLQTSLNTYFDNVWFYQLYGDVNVTPKLNLGASLSYAYADEKPSAQYVSDKYGYELDVTMKYKIYDNLEYMVGAAYLWTGDYFKGTNDNVKLYDNYLITHKLTLTF